MNNRHPITQILIRAAWISFYFLLGLAVLLGGNVNWTEINYARLYGYALVPSAIVQIFKKSKPQSPQQIPKTYLDVVTELLQGDRAAAIRLFNYNKEKFGGKTDEWVWQKVIRDIERDRR
ncbi:MAG: hypothetical protein NW214_08655 [Pseudanabaenaceae cyanobacterium bins.39]|nr:hypothetical protein [Pseudanabaenaceae cyanobacterium bins.39]